MFARLKRWFYGTDDDVSDWPVDDDYDPDVTLRDLSIDLDYLTATINLIRTDIDNLRTEILDRLESQGNLVAENADLRLQIESFEISQQIPKRKTQDVTYGNLYQAMVVEPKPKPTKKRAKK